MDFRIPIQIRWSDIDPNVHLRHSVYYDWGAMCRVMFFSKHGLSVAVMQQLFIGPVIFREECVFRKEIHFGDEVSIDIQLVKSRRDYSRWTVRHAIYKQESIAALITVDGAWIDLVKRKLALPPALATDLFNDMTKPEDFIWEEK